MADDIDRAYIINGDDLRIVLEGDGPAPPLVPNPRDIAEYIIGSIARPYPIELPPAVTRDELAKALDAAAGGVWSVTGSDGETYGKLRYPDRFAECVLDLLHKLRRADRAPAGPERTDTVTVTAGDLNDALDGFWLWVVNSDDKVHGRPENPAAVASTLFAWLRNRQEDGELEGQDEPEEDEPEAVPSGYEDVDAITTILRAVDALSGESGAGWGYAVNVLRFVAGRYGLKLTEDYDA